MTGDSAAADVAAREGFELLRKPYRLDTMRQAFTAARDAKAP